MSLQYDSCVESHAILNEMLADKDSLLSIKYEEINLVTKKYNILEQANKSLNNTLDNSIKDNKEYIKKNTKLTKKVKILSIIAGSETLILLLLIII